jgi:hypothetical protein
MYRWTVPALNPGNYTMELIVDGNQSDGSPTFQIHVAPSGTTSMTTPMMMMAATGTCTGVSATPYVYYDTKCGCTKTAVAPARPAVIGGMNYTVPRLTAPTMPLYTGGASRVSGILGWAGIAVAFLAVAVAA